MIEIYHNPRCSKSRNALKYLEEKGLEVKVVRYLDTPPSKSELKEIVDKLGFKSARELMRTKEAIYTEQALRLVEDEGELIKAMIHHPKLIERPIVINGNKAVVARPEEEIEKII